jgi:hypothetical protein
MGFAILVEIVNIRIRAAQARQAPVQLHEAYVAAPGSPSGSPRAQAPGSP